MMATHFWRTGLSATLVATSMAAGLATPALAEKTLMVGRLKANLNMHPMVQVNTTKRNDIGFATWPITAFDPDGNNVCRLCDELPTIENGLAKIVDRPDGTEGMEVTIRLAEGLHWGDGEPVTSDDIVFTWEMASDPAMGFVNFNPWNRADDVEVVDDRTVIMKLPKIERSYASWDQILPEHLERPIYEQYPNVEEYSKNSLYNAETTSPGIWNGPFVFTDWRPGTAVELVRNPHWPGPGPELDRIVFTYRDNNSALMQTLLADAVEYVLVSPGGINLAQMLEIRRNFPDRYEYLVEPGPNYDRIAFNLDNPALADVRVRQAIAHGFDRQAISDILFEGLAPAAQGPLPPNNPYYDEEVLQTYPYDPEAAKTLLADAGWTPSPDGICVNDAGDRLSIEFITTAGERTREQMAQVIQNQLKEACIDMPLRFVPQNEFSEIKREREFSGMLMGAVNFPPSASPGLMFGSDGIPSEANAWVGENFSGYQNPEMDAAVAKVDAALTQKDAAEGWREIQRIATRELPMLPLYFSAEAIVTQKHVSGITGGAVDPRSLWANEWDKDS